MWPLVKLVLGAEEYSFGDKANYMKGNIFSLEHLWPAVIHTNLFTEIDSMQIPVYIFQGIYDYQTPQRKRRSHGTRFPMAPIIINASRLTNRDSDWHRRVCGAIRRLFPTADWRK